jgi:protein-S-isoprenylcysteine O-methyltransferase Ste14
MNLPIPESIKPWLNFFHPAIMWVLLAMTIYALYLGIKVRNSRTATETEKKKEFGKLKAKHHEVGSLLLALMVVGAIGAMAVTYINNGKLFVGPHLVAGLGMTGAIAVSASLTPFMQKGQDWARYTHISLNVSLLGVFVWQAFTGVEILLRIISKM